MWPAVNGWAFLTQNLQIEFVCTMIVSSGPAGGPASCSRDTNNYTEVWKASFVVQQLRNYLTAACKITAINKVCRGPCFLLCLHLLQLELSVYQMHLQPTKSRPNKAIFCLGKTDNTSWVLLISIMCNSNSGIGIGIGFRILGIFRVCRMTMELNRRLKSELELKFSRVDLESELNRA